MFGKIEKNKIFVIFAFLSALVLCGCGNSSPLQASVQIQGEIKENKPLLTPQYKLDASPRYRFLKKQVEETRNQAETLESERDILFAKYTEEYPKLKKVSKRLNETRQLLDKLEKDLDDEARRLGYTSANSPV